MTLEKAVKIQKEIQAILEKNDIYHKIEYVQNPSLKFINMEVSIKVTKEIKADDIAITRRL